MFYPNCFLERPLKAKDICDVNNDRCGKDLACAPCKKIDFGTCQSSNHVILLFVDLFVVQVG